MIERARRSTKRGGGTWHYRDTLRLLKQSLQPVDPDPMFSSRLEDLCESMGAEELFLMEQESGSEGVGRKGIIIGGAICSALPFVGVTAYAIRKRHIRRRVSPMGA